MVFHNLSKYDAHLFIRELAEEFDVNEMEVLAENTEKYISFSVPIRVGLSGGDKGNEEQATKTCKLRFIDSYRFMQSSLSDLVDNLAGTNTDDIICEKCKDNMEFIAIDEGFVAKFECKNCYYSMKSRQLDERTLKYNFYNLYRYCGSDDDVFRLLLRKGVYPYEHMDSFERFNETKLPPIESFYSEFNLSAISKNDYKHAKKVYEVMDCRDLGDYHDIYLCSDVMLLADVFESFRDRCQRIYGLDPAHFYTAPGLAWQAALKKTGVELELLTDKDMLLFFEKGIRGGICQAIMHYAEANNPYMGRGKYKPDKESSYLQYLDANNLYGWAMTQKLPTHGFKWVEDPMQIDSNFVLNYIDGEDGYVLGG